MSKTLSLHHIVFGTKHREATLNPGASESLHRFITYLLKNNQCFLYRVNSVPDHVHLLIDLNPTKALSKIVGEIKSQSSQWLKTTGHNPLFRGWGEGYYASSLSPAHRDACIEYINGQQQHHKLQTFDDEIQWLYKRAGLSWYEEDML